MTSFRQFAAYLKILCDQDTSELFRGYVNHFKYEKAIEILDGLAVEDSVD